MPQHTNFALVLFLATWVKPSLAYSDSSLLQIYCNQHTGAFFVSSDPDDEPRSSKHFKKQSVDWISLLKMGPQKNGWGDPLRTGSRSVTKKCGDIKITFSSGFLNPNPQGELGAFDFPVVEIRKNKKVLLARTALEQCDVQLSRYNYFGTCPGSWAQSIEILPTAKGHIVQVKRIFTDEEYKDASRMDIYK